MLHAGGEIHVWTYRVKEADYLAEATSPILGNDEIIRASAFVNEADRLRYVAVHRFLRQVLSQYSSAKPQEIEFKRDKYGKPYLTNRGVRSKLKFNLSYRGEFALVAISSSFDPGVDVELERTIDDPDTFNETYFSAPEITMLYEFLGATGEDGTFNMWTMKEAYIKALGTGFNTNLLSIDLSRFILSPYHKSPDDNWEHWTIEPIFFDEDKYIGAVAARGRGITIKKYDFLP